MYYYHVFTLFDITATGAIRHPKPTETNHKALLLLRNQQRNWETIQQALGMRAQIYIDSLPDIIESCNMFSKKKFKNTQAWHFRFGVETADVYGSDLNLLLADCHGIPMILGLNELAKIPQPILECRGEIINTYIHFDNQA